MKTLIAMLVLLVVSYADDNRCIVEKPAAVTPARVMVPACHRANANIQQAIAAEITNQYMPEQGGKPQVKFPCDGLGARIHEIVIETGDGHSGVLELWSAKRRPDGKYDVRGIVYRGNSMLRTASPIPHEQASGVVELPEIDKARAAITATVREIVPPTRPGDSFSIRRSGSSRDFHSVVRLVDDEGRVVERRYTGYLGSSTQDAYLGLQIAQTALAPITSVAPGAAAADADDKRFFAASFNAAVPYFDEPFYWWVMERYVDMARFLGTPAVIGGLLTRLTVTKTGNRSQTDAREDAVDALAKITGWDARKGKSIEDAAKAYLATCR
jgi:hypothetical protein